MDNRLPGHLDTPLLAGPRCAFFPALVSLALLFSFSRVLPAQNPDSLIVENTRRFTVFDQISVLPRKARWTLL